MTVAVMQTSVKLHSIGARFLFLNDANKSFCWLVFNQWEFLRVGHTDLFSQYVSKTVPVCSSQNS